MTGRKRSYVLFFAIGLGAAVATGIYVLARAVRMTIDSWPDRVGDEVPTGPSLRAALLYWGFLMPRKYLALPLLMRSLALLRAPMRAPVRVPSDIQVETVTGAGVPAEIFSARGASRSRFILYLHGGAFLIGVVNLHRDLISSLSRATGASVLLPDYRLAPEHPFPAALEDCLAAYRWLLQQGVPPSQIVVAGESSGGNLTLALAVALRDRGDPLPSALVALSPVFDHALTGESCRTKAQADPVGSLDFVRRSIAAYTHNGAVDVRHPLISPLYADMRSLPPTLILVGTQEVLLSDATRMADQLREALVPVTLEIWPGMIHIWPALPERLMPEVTLARQHIVTFIERSLGTSL